LDSKHRQFDRLLGQVDHSLRVNLLDVPEVGRVVGAEELVGRPFPPAIEAPFIKADGVTASALGNIDYGTALVLRHTGGRFDGTYGLEPCGVGPVFTSDGRWKQSMPDFYPILGAGGDFGSSVGYYDNNPVPDGFINVIGYTACTCADDPSTVKMAGFDVRTVVGPDRPYRFAAGGGGGRGSSGANGGDGGGILLIKAPGIVFGDNARISARGEDAGPNANDNAGGGGGGHVEIWTTTELSPTDQAKIDAHGGAGGTSGYAGLDGVVILERLA
jgi:hypothetical protein